VPDLEGLEFGGTTSAAEKLQQLAPRAHVVKAFNTIGAPLLGNATFDGLEADGYYCGDDDAAKAAVAPLIAAIRIGPNRHIAGLVCQNDLVVTTDQELPALESYTVVLPGQAVSAARPAGRLSSVMDGSRPAAPTAAQQPSQPRLSSTPPEWCPEFAARS